MLTSNTLKIIEPYSWWLQGMQTASRSDEEKNKLKEIDNICLKAEKTNKEVLKNKAKKLISHGKLQNYINQEGYIKKFTKLTDKEIEIKRQIDDFLNEIYSYEIIKKKSFSNIEFIVEQKYKTPDIKAKKDNTDYFFEIKSIHITREQEDNLRKNNGWILGNVNTNFRDGLIKKIYYFCCDAEKKFNAVNIKDRVLILFYEPDINARLVVNFNTKLNNIFNKNFIQNLERQYKLKIWIENFYE